MKGNTHI